VCENLIGNDRAAYEGTVTSTKLKVTGIEVFSVGDFIGSAQSESLILSDPGGAIYRKLVIENNQLTGAVLYGEMSHSPWYMDLIIEQTDVNKIRDQLMFGCPQESSVSVIA
jgi:nitrite reductase (NADH) large subunit